MAKYLMTGLQLCRNLGGPSLLLATMQVLSKADSGAEFTLLSAHKEDLPLAKTYDVEVITRPSQGFNLFISMITKAIFNINIGSEEIREFINKVKDPDILIDLRGICFTDSIGRDSFAYRFSQGKGFLLYGKLFRRPVVKYTSDMGPFKTRWNSYFAKIYFNRFTDLIFARGKTTYNRLKELGIKTPVFVFPDTAFLMEHQDSELSGFLREQKKESPVIGFSVSHMAARQSSNPEEYYKIMASLADYIVESSDAILVFIPNELSRIKERDDLHVSKTVVDKMVNRKKTFIMDKDYTAPELKGIINQCDSVVAARYHTIVASLSLGIPVFVIGWHSKYLDILNLFNQSDYLFDVSSLDILELKQKYNDFWLSREKNINQINTVLPKLKQSILKAGELVISLSQKKII